MKLFPPFNSSGVLIFFLLLFAAPAFAQFEVSPDHFDGSPQASVKPKPAAPKTASKKKVDSDQSALSPQANSHKTSDQNMSDAALASNASVTTAARKPVSRPAGSSRIAKNTGSTRARRGV